MFLSFFYIIFGALPSTDKLKKVLGLIDDIKFSISMISCVRRVRKKSCETFI